MHSQTAYLRAMELLAQTRLPSKWGEYVISAYGEKGDRFPHVALHRGLEALSGEFVPVRIHSECMTGDVFGSRRCDCGDQLSTALGHFREIGGILIYLRQEGRGIGFVEKLEAYNLQDAGMDTYEANVARGHQEDARSYEVAAEILKKMEVDRVRLLTNNPEKVNSLQAFGFEVEREPVVIEPNDDNKAYLKSKADVKGHWF